jgi:protein SCO1/2
MRDEFNKARPIVNFRLRIIFCRKLRYNMRILSSTPYARLMGLICLSVFLTSCQRKASEPAPPPQVFTVKGVMEELEPDGKTAVIRHEAIPGYMQAMTMPFEARDTNQLSGLKPGDRISFRLAVTPTGGWIEAVTKLGSAASEPRPKPAIRVSRTLEPLEVGNRLPDYHFTNELGEAVNLSQFKGQVLALTFFFTSCPFPDYCPRMTGNFAKAQKLLETTANAPAHWRLLSISFDPAHDTPSRLAAYARAADYDKSHWSFLTGSEDQIGGLAEQMGENYWQEAGSFGHNLRTVVVDAGGHIRNIIPGNKWSAGELARDMAQAGLYTDFP